MLGNHANNTQGGRAVRKRPIAAPAATPKARGPEAENGRGNTQGRGPKETNCGAGNPATDPVPDETDPGQDVLLLPADAPLHLLFSD